MTIKSFFSYLLESQKSTLDTTIWSTENTSGSLRELLDSTKQFSSVVSMEIDKLLPKIPNITNDNNEEERIRMVNLSYPVTVLVNENGDVYSIPDGHHRIRAAKRLGLLYIPCTVIPISALNNKFRELFL